MHTTGVTSVEGMALAKGLSYARYLFFCLVVCFLTGHLSFARAQMFQVEKPDTAKKIRSEYDIDISFFDVIKEFFKKFLFWK